MREEGKKRERRESKYRDDWRRQIDKKRKEVESKEREKERTMEIKIVE
jgi:hypothetical protein